MPSAHDEAKASDSATRGVVSRTAHDEAKAEDSASASVGIPPGSPIPVFAPQPPSSDEQERLRSEQSEAASILMRQRFPSGPRCPFCRHDDFNVGYFEVIYPYIGGIVAAVVDPVFQVTCLTCGYISFFNPRIAGVQDGMGNIVPPPYPPIPPVPDQSGEEQEP
ncbi:MAG: hypothetical protein ACREP9_08105 [Candidatus Dormibacteraceae bacterium]